MEHSTLPPVETPARYMRLLGREEFARLMGACIETVLERRGGLAAGEARRLRWETLRSFSGLLAARTRRVRAVTKSECLAELERTHGALLRERARNTDELAGIEQELVQARGDAQTAMLTPEEERRLELALAADLRALLASGESEPELARVLQREAQRRRAALAAIVARERERIDQLERRLVKLRAAQTEMEAALAELARRAEIDGGLPSIYRSVQGLASAESQREAKATMLARIFQENLVLQNKVVVPQPSVHPVVAGALVAQQKSA